MKVERNRAVVLAEDHIDYYVGGEIYSWGVEGDKCWPCWEELDDWIDWYQEEPGEYDTARLPFPENNTLCEFHTRQKGLPWK